MFPKQMKHNENITNKGFENSVCTARYYRKTFHFLEC